MQRVQISGEESALSFLPHSELYFHIPFLCWRMWHISISLFSLIRICWLNINEINSSWWHWIRLLFEYACLCSAHWLHGVNLTPWSAQLFEIPVCFLSGLPQVGSFLHQGWKIHPKLWFSLKLTFFFFALGVGRLLMPACGGLECPPLPPTPSLYSSCRQWILIEAWLSDNL